MKKISFGMLAVTGLLILSLACNKKLVTPSALAIDPTPTETAASMATATPVYTATATEIPVSIPTATPTVNLTPVCGFTTLPTPLAVAAISNMGVTVIRTEAEWLDYTQVNCSFIVGAGTPTPTPTPIVIPVDFDTQMVVAAAVPWPCWAGSFIIADVCVGPDTVTVYATEIVCPGCMVCQAVNDYCRINQLVAVPQSGLPVSFVYDWVFE